MPMIGYNINCASSNARLDSINKDTQRQVQRTDTGSYAESNWRLVSAHASEELRASKSKKKTTRILA